MDEIIWGQQYGFRLTDQLLIRFFAFIGCRRKNTICQLFEDFKKAYDSVRREI
jgi:hypothetical protein